MILAGANSRCAGRAPACQPQRRPARGSAQSASPDGGSAGRPGRRTFITMDAEGQLWEVLLFAQGLIASLGGGGLPALDVEAFSTRRGKAPDPLPPQAADFLPHVEDGLGKGPNP